MTREESLIYHVIDSLKNIALSDIRKVSSEDNVLASFILCSCFIDQVSGFRYNQDAVKSRYQKFVGEYLPNYNPKKLYEDLRNKLVHNYSLGDTYSLTRLSPQLHLKIVGVRIIINLENFISELEDAFTRYEDDLKSNSQAKSNALTWFERFNILTKDNHDFLTYEEAEKIVLDNLKKIKGFSKLKIWPYHLRYLLITPTSPEIETMGKIITVCRENNCTNKEALINLSIFDNNTFDVYIVGVDKLEGENVHIAFIKLSDYHDWSENALK